MRLVTFFAFFNSFTVLILIITGILKTKPTFMAKQSIHNKKAINTAHRHAGRTILITGLIHGYLALGGFRFHPGQLLYMFILLNVVFILMFKKTKKKVFFKLHKYFPILIVVMLSLHYLSMNGII